MELRNQNENLQANVLLSRVAIVLVINLNQGRIVDIMTPKAGKFSRKKRETRNKANIPLVL
jgi:hypothetical protein